MLLSPDLLRAFGSAAYQLSFTAAAEELGTAQPTVSQQIRRLGKELATSLLQRVHRGIMFIDADQPLPRHVTASLGMTDAGIATLDACQCHGVPQVAIDYAFAVYWLVPHFSRFHQVHPYLDVSLVIGERGLAGQRGDIGVAVLFGDGRFKYDEAHRLFREEVFPVCSPWLVEGLQLPLAKTHLMCLLMPYPEPVQHARWPDWSVLFEVLVIDQQLIPAMLSFDNYTLLIQAAIVGQGVVIGWRHLADGLLEQGLFCQPIDESCLSRHGYYAVLSERERHRRLVDGFVDQLQAELQAGGA